RLPSGESAPDQLPTVVNECRRISFPVAVSRQTNVRSRQSWFSSAAITDLASAERAKWVTLPILAIVRGGPSLVKSQDKIQPRSSPVKRNRPSGLKAR